MYTKRCLLSSTLRDGGWTNKMVHYQHSEHFKWLPHIQNTNEKTKIDGGRMNESGLFSTLLTQLNLKFYDTASSMRWWFTNSPPMRAPHKARNGTACSHAKVKWLPCPNHCAAATKVVQQDVDCNSFVTTRFLQLLCFISTNGEPKYYAPRWLPKACIGQSKSICVRTATNCFHAFRLESV